MKKEKKVKNKSIKSRNYLNIDYKKAMNETYKYI